MSGGLEDEKEARSKSRVSIQSKEMEVQSLKMKVDEIRAEKEDVARSLTKLNEDYLNMKFYLENLVKTKDELKARAKELSEKEGISLGTVVVKQMRN